MKRRRKSKFVIDQGALCPLCGAAAVCGGELTFKRKRQPPGQPPLWGKWYGPYLGFACGAFLVMPGCAGRNEREPEIWNLCSTVRAQGGKVSRGVVDITEYEITEAKKREWFDPRLPVATPEPLLTGAT